MTLQAHQAISYRKLATYLACRRRFQLRYLSELAWPEPPQQEEWRQAADRGRAFHRLLERHFLGLPVDEPAELLQRDSQLSSWWRIFLAEGPRIPAGLRLPELSLTVPLGQRLVSGRFDLLVLDDEEAHIFDWKTESRPRTRAELADDWQTSLYMALLVEGSRALHRERRAISPEQISFTYWFVNEPTRPVTFQYGATAHAEKWAKLAQLAAEMNAPWDEGEVWPLTDDLRICGRCAYQVVCSRSNAPAGIPPEWELEDDVSDEPSMRF